MLMARKITGDSMDEWLHPPFRKVDFAGESAVKMMAFRLRQSWLTRPVFDYSGLRDGADMKAGISQQMQALQACQGGQQEVESTMGDPDRETIHTPLRDRVYDMYQHVFWDVSGFLTAAADGIGHYHPPRHEVLPVYHPPARPPAAAPWAADIMVPVAERTFDEPILVIPAYLEPGAKLVVASAAAKTAASEPTVDGSGVPTVETENQGVVFDATGAGRLYDEPVIGWVKAGQPIKISLGGAHKGAGLAAVLVIGRMCTRETAETAEAEEAVEEKGHVEEGDGAPAPAEEENGSQGQEFNRPSESADGA